MLKINPKRSINIFVSALMVVALAVVYLPGSVSAAQITNRSVTIGSSQASAVTTYNFAFSVPSNTAIKSADFLACTTASGTCTTPTGFSAASSTLTSQPTGMGATTGWTAASVAGDFKIANSSNTTAPSANQTVAFSTVTNPSATNSTFFFRISTYSTATYATVIDNGTVATSTAGQVTVTASVDEALTFTLANTTVPLGTLTSSATGSGTASMTASTNASTGYSISYTGTTLSSGGNQITALTSPTASSINNSQFGFNLVNNTTPAVGTAVSGSGTGAPAAGYNTANSFKFSSGDTIATASVPTNSNTYTASYIANINGVTPPGSYSTVLTYVATANF